VTQNAEGGDASLDIIIVNWNCGGQLRECLKSIMRANDSGPFVLRRILVVDNASSDGSADGLDDLPLPLTVVRNDTNKGFAAACNQGAAGSDAGFLLFLNPDTRLLPGSISQPVRAILAPENAAVGIVGVQLVDAKGKVTPTCARFLTPAMIARKIFGLDRFTGGLWLPHFMTDWDHKGSAEVDHVMGAFYLVRRTLFVRLGGMDERFFVYLEDLDFSLRAKQAGFGTLYVTDAQVYHRGAGASDGARARSLFYALSSRVAYGFKHFATWKAWALLFGTLLFEPLTRIAYAGLRGSPARIRDTLTAYWWLLNGLPTLIRTRGQRLEP